GRAAIGADQTGATVLRHLDTPLHVAPLEIRTRAGGMFQLRRGELPNRLEQGSCTTSDLPHSDSSRARTARCGTSSSLQTTAAAAAVQPSRNVDNWMK